VTARERILAAFHDAVARADLPGRVARALGEDGPFVVIAAGKAATSMLAGVRDFSRALVVIPRGSAAPNDPRVTVPDESSVRAAEAALALAASDAPEERLFLISGGASSLLCAPAPGLGLDRKREVVDTLLRAELPISDVNVVRRHLSRVKGGGLARACGARPRRTLIVSDVLGDAPEGVGSGPSVADPTTIEDAARVAAGVGCADLPFVETWKHRERAELVATPRDFAETMAAALVERGFEARAFADAGRDVAELARRYAEIVTEMKPGDARVRAAEPVLRVPPSAGRGGR